MKCLKAKLTLVFQGCETLHKSNSFSVESIGMNVCIPLICYYMAIFTTYVCVAIHSSHSREPFHSFSKQCFEDMNLYMTNVC